MERKYLEKHLDIIQQNINRMASNSFMIKGWLIALISAGFVFISKEYSFLISVASIIMTIGFALLDTMYLQTERKFRKLYDIVVFDSEQERIKDLEINIEHELILSDVNINYWRCLISKSIIIPYIFLIIYNVVLFILIKI